MALDPMKRSLAKAVTCSLLLLLRLQTVTGWPAAILNLDVFGYVRGFFFPPSSLCRCVFCVDDTGMSGWGGCLDGQDVFVSIRENSPSGVVVADLMTETTLEGVHWGLGGKDADWLFLDEGNIRLNLSDGRVLDREVTELEVTVDQKAEKLLGISEIQLRNNYNLIVSV